MQNMQIICWEYAENMLKNMLKICWKYAELYVNYAEYAQKYATNMCKVCNKIREKYAEYALKYAQYVKYMGKWNMQRICTKICKICKICEQKFDVKYALPTLLMLLGRHAQWGLNERHFFAKGFIKQGLFSKILCLLCFMLPAGRL